MSIRIRAGATLLLLGPALHAQFPVLTELHGPTSSSSFGARVGAVGDVDGDGVPDVLVGAPDDGLGGRAFVYSGKTGLVIFQPAVSPSSGDFGAAVTGLGDVTNDGVPDFAVADPSFDGAVSDGGAVWVYSGATGLPLFAQLLGTHQSGIFGHSISSVVDLDGDGRNDLLVGEPQAPGGGAVHAYASTGTHLFTVTPGTLLGNTHQNQDFGFAVCGVGDLTGDGRGEFLIGDPRAVIAGVQLGAAYLVVAPAPNPVTFSALFTGAGPADLSRYGDAVSGGGLVRGQPGDFDGDAVPDFVIGAPRHAANGGTVYAYSGKPNHPTLFVSDGVSVLGAPAQDAWYGHSVAGAGDVDGDQRDDVIVGAPMAAVATGTGLAHVRSPGKSHAVLDASQAGERYGWSVAGLGDLDGDGRDDVAIGAPLHDQAPKVDNGRVELRTSCPNPPLAYGVGCPSSANSVPTLSVHACLAPLATGTLRIEGGLPNALGVLLLGLNQVEIALAGGCHLRVQPVLPISALVPLDASGEQTVPLNFPAGLTPFTFTVQAFLQDGGHPLGFHTSNGLQLTYP